jgi:hypothetical protein
MVMDPVTGAVITTGLKSAAALAVAKPAAELLKDFLGRIFAPTGDALGQVGAYPIVEWQKRRVERAAKLVQRAAELVVERGEIPQAVPGRLLFPILERGSVEEDEELAERWATLLANASTSPAAVLPAFASILGELSPHEAVLLRHVQDVAIELGPYERATNESPSFYRRRDEVRSRLWVSSLEQELGLAQMPVLCANLQRLGLVSLDSGGGAVAFTQFGQAFIEACEPTREVKGSIQTVATASSPSTTPQSDPAES